MNKIIKKIYKILIVAMILFAICSYTSNVYATEELVVDAKASLIVEVNSGKIIHENNARIENYPASLTKILTAILTIENCKLDEIATVSQSALSDIPVSYVVAPLYAGEKIAIEDLLYALMLKSANDAAYVLAEHVGGSIDGFAEMMNNKAKEIGCTNSHFVNPNGIHDDNHYTTAYDMYLISKYAMENEVFAKIVSTYKYTLPASNKYLKSNRVMENRNFFVNPSSKYYDKNVKGIKTGTTSQAGNCLITEVSKNDLDIITVVLGAESQESKFAETKKMINYTFENYIYTKLHQKGDVIKNIEVKRATKETKNLNLVISDELDVINNINTNVKEIEPEIILKDNITAPIQKGEEIGTIKYTIEGIEYKAKLLAENDVELKTYQLEILLGCGILFVIVCIRIVVIKKKRKKRKQQYKKRIAR